MQIMICLNVNLLSLFIAHNTCYVCISTFDGNAEVSGTLNFSSFFFQEVPGKNQAKIPLHTHYNSWYFLNWQY